MKESDLQFVNPYLESLYFDSNTDYIGCFEENDLAMQNVFSVNIKRKKNINKAHVALTLDINQDNMDAPFMLHITVASDFIWQNMHEEQIKKMLESNAPALLLSYMRPIVANVTNSSFFPAYNLPFINFLK